MIQMILLQPLDVPPTHRPLQSGLVLQHLLDRLYLFLLRRFSSSFCPPAPGAVHKHGGRGHHHGRLGRDGNGAPVGARVLATGQAVAGQARDGDGMRDTQHLRSDARPPPIEQTLYLAVASHAFPKGEVGPRGPIAIQGNFRGTRPLNWEKRRGVRGTCPIGDGE